MRQSLNESLLHRLADNPSDTRRQGDRLYDLLRDNDFGGLEALLQAFFAGIPYQWHTRNDIADYEGYYASVFYALFASAGLDMTVEDSTSRGRVDLTVRLDGSVYLFEFKVVDAAPPGSSPGPASVARRRDGAATRARLRGQVPGSGPADPPDRGGAQQGDPQSGGVRGSTGVKRAAGRLAPDASDPARCSGAR